MTQAIEHDEWAMSPPRYEKKSAINLNGIHGILDFDGRRNPSGRSTRSNKVFIPYETPANDWQTKIGIAESAAEAAVAYEALCSPNLWDLTFQPLTVTYDDADGVEREHTFDLRITVNDGRQRLVFVRNERSLMKATTQMEIALIRATLSPELARSMVVVNATDYTRQRRENLERMYHLLRLPCPAQDEAVLEHAIRMPNLYRMIDLHAGLPLQPWQIFQSCLRLIARKALKADLDAVITHYSRVEVAT